MAKRQTKDTTAAQTQAADLEKRLADREQEIQALKRNSFATAVANSIMKESRAYTPYNAKDFPGYGTAGTRPGLIPYRTMNRVYEQNSIVRAVIDTKVSMFMSLDWDIVSKDKKNDPDQANREQLRTLFTEPNDGGDDWNTLMRKFLRDLFCLDAASMEVVRNPYGEPTELWPLDASTITAIKDEHGRIERYEQRVYPSSSYYGIQSGIGLAEKRVDFEPDDLIYINQFPTTYRIWGMSPIESLTVEIGADLYAMTYNAMNFVEGQLFDKILVLGRIGQEALERCVATLEANRGKAHRLPVLSDLEDADKAKVIDFRSKAKDMEFMQFEEWLVKRICTTFQINPNDLMEFYQSATRASAEVQERISEHKAIRPVVQMLQSAFTRAVIKPIDPTLEFRFQQQRLSEQQKAEVFKAKVQAGYPINRVLRELGEEPIEFEMTLPDGSKVNPYDHPNLPTPGPISDILAPGTGSSAFGPKLTEMIKAVKANAGRSLQPDTARHEPPGADRRAGIEKTFIQTP